MGQEEAPPTPNPAVPAQSFQPEASAPPYDPDAPAFGGHPGAPGAPAGGPPAMGMPYAQPVAQPYMMQGMEGDQGVVVGQPVGNPGQYYPPQHPAQPYPVQTVPYQRQNSDFEQFGAVAVLIGGCLCYPIWLLGWMCISHRDPSTRVMGRVSACMGTTICFAFGLWILIVIMTGAAIGNGVSKMEQKCEVIRRYDSRACLDNPFCRYCGDSGRCYHGSDLTCSNSFVTESAVCNYYKYNMGKCSKATSCTLDLRWKVEDPAPPSRSPTATTTTGGTFSPPIPPSRYSPPPPLSPFAYRHHGSPHGQGLCQTAPIPV